MKICILGNSHTASLKQGWGLLEATCPDISIDFFAARKNKLSGLAVRGDCLIPTNPELASFLAFTSGGKKEVKLTEYDCFLVYGLGLQLHSWNRNTSRAVSYLVGQDTLRSSLNYRLATKIRSVTSAPLYLGHNPMVANKSANLSRAHLLNYQEVLGYFHQAIDMRDAILVPQPAETIDQDWYTKNEYSKGSVTLDVGDAGSNVPHQDSDNYHMNGEFGQLYLRNFLDKL